MATPRRSAATDGTEGSHAELTPRAGGERVGVLIRALRSDDLLDDTPAVLALPPRAGASVNIGRRAQDGAGFDAQGDIGLGNRRASTRHAQLVHGGEDSVGPRWTVRDLGSKNGTFVGGERIDGAARLVDGDTLEVGHTVFVVRFLPVDRAEAVLAARAPRGLGPTATRCAEIAALAGDLERIAPTGEPVLVLGETGVGKELVARNLHAASRRAGALVTIDCGAVPETLFEATLFGHRRGAFTGAHQTEVGAIARADRGTMVLDEVANMSLASQATLLRVVETGEVAQVGGAEARRVDVRWVAATNVDPFDHPGFRQDLLRRLAGWVARVPPLRRRREDLGILAAHVLREAGARRASMTSAAARAFVHGAFPGNVRQLRAALRSAVVLAGDHPIEIEHLRDGGSLPGVQKEVSADTTDSAEAATRARVPTPEQITTALGAARGNVVHAARALGTHPRQLYRWIERHGIDLEAARKV